MRKTQILGAVVLAMLIAGVNSGVIHATDGEPTEQSVVEYEENGESEDAESEAPVEDEGEDEAETLVGQNEDEVPVTSRKSTDLDTAISLARVAQEYAAAHPSTVYPGIDEYIARLIAQVEQGLGTEAQAIEALNDATELTYMLLGNNNSQRVSNAYTSTLSTNSGVSVSNTQTNTNVEKNEIAQVTPQKNQGVAIALEVKSEEKNDDKNTENASTEEQAEDVVELPKTGMIEHEAGIGEMILAGVIVVLATTGLAAVIIRSKRNA